MTEEQVKIKLLGYLEARERFEVAKLKLIETENMITGISVSYSDTKVKTSPKTLDRVGELIDRLNNQRNACIDEAFRANKQMDEVQKLIKKAGDATLESLLTRHYIIGDKWEKVADDMGYDDRYIFKLHDEAIKRVAQC